MLYILGTTNKFITIIYIFKYSQIQTFLTKVSDSKMGNKVTALSRNEKWNVLASNVGQPFNTVKKLLCQILGKVNYMGTILKK
jgi:hypothetical protein